MRWREVNETPEIVSLAVNVRKSDVAVRLLLKQNADCSNNRPDKLKFIANDACY